MPGRMGPVMTVQQHHRGPHPAVPHPERHLAQVHMLQAETVEHPSKPTNNRPFNGAHRTAACALRRRSGRCVYCGAMVLARFTGIRPAAVVPCKTPAEVAVALADARGDGRAVAVRGGGHCFAGRSSATGVVIDISPMTGVRVDGDRAVIGAGTRLAEVYDALAAHGRTVPAGCGPTVGIAGLTLGGGLGILGRRYGLTCDSLEAATVVLADGRAVDADDDLLWALRGGGAPGVVTSLTLRTVPAPDSTAFRLTFPAAAASSVLDAWQDLVPELDEALAPSLVITVPPEPARPPVVTVFGAAPHTASVDGLIRRLGERPASDQRQHGTHRAATPRACDTFGRPTTRRRCSRPRLATIGRTALLFRRDPQLSPVRCAGCAAAVRPARAGSA
jgi:FAD/FMN-containing dehydrogenase